MSGIGGKRVTLALGAVLVTSLALAVGPASAAIVHPFEDGFNGQEAPGGPFFAVMGAAADASGGGSKGDVYIAVSNLAEEGFPSVVDKFHEDGSYAGVQVTGSETPQKSFSFVASTFLLSGVDVDSSTSPNHGDLYVADVAHGVVDRFSEAGKFICQITGKLPVSKEEQEHECNGAAGSKTPAESLAPTGLAVDSSGDVYVADGAHDVIDEFGPKGELIEPEIKDPHITAPAALALDSSGDLYVTNFFVVGEPSERSVVKLNSKHEFVAILDSSRPTAVAADPTSGHIDVYEESEPQPEIAEYDASGNLVERFGAGHFEGELLGLAVGPAGNVYAGPFTFSGGGVVDIFGPAVVVPNVSTAPATDVQQTSVTLNGHVDPDAEHGGGVVTECKFEYGTSSSYGQTAPCTPPTPYSSAREVSASVSGLSPGTLYHFRLEAANADAVPSRGADETVTTSGPPSVISESATAEVTSARLEAQINPFGFDTACQVQYIDEASFQSSGYAGAVTVPCTPEDLGSSFGARGTGATLAGLQLDTVYHFRFIVSNEAGMEPGADETFATFGINEFSFGVLGEEGQPVTQAGAHPYQVTDSFTLNTTTKLGSPEETDANPHEVQTELPPGLIGNPDATPKCSPYNVAHADCQGASQVGILTLYTSSEPTTAKEAPLYNLEPPVGVAAQFGARFNGFVTAHIDAKIRTGGDYGVTADALDISAGEGIIRASVTLWGVPAEASHDAQRYCPVPGAINERAPCESDAPLVPFLRNPTSCLGMQTAEMRADSWQSIGSFVQADSQMPGFNGCGRLSFTPRVTIQPESAAADSPTGVHVDLRVPQNGDPSGLAEADLKDAAVTLPAGVTVNPSSANGLQACSPVQVELNGSQPARCPDASKIGSVQIDTPLIDHPLDGGVYVAQQGNHGLAQGSNPFSSLLALYIAVDDPQSGVVIKLAGEVAADPVTGRLTTSFLNNPQLPFEELKLDISGGPRAPLATPPACGSYTTTASLVPWSAPESGAPATPSSTFAITTGPRGTACADPRPFAPSLTSGSANVQAGGFTPLTTTFSREDGNQNLAGITLHLPPGLLGKLAAVTPCAEPQAAEGTCGAGSLIGHTVVSAGLGPDPDTIAGGKVFITGPYKGAPYGLSLAEPAKAGPFDLGTGPCDCIVVRAKIEVDPHTSALTVVSDPLPTILQGIPLQLKRVNVTVDRPGFTFNPTNCSQLAINATLTGEQGATASASVPFEVANCATLPFRPKFTVATQARSSRVNGASLHVKLTSGPGQANVGKVKVALPRQLPSRLSTLHQACLAAAFEANPATCPAGSLVGTATAVTPVLKSPLRGPAYLVSHGGAAFPDLEVVLQGEGITLILDGHTDIKKGITTSSFDTVPDAPVTSFDLTLPEGPHSALAAFLPSKAKGSLCGQRLTMPTAITGQNGAVLRQTTRIAVSGCPKRKAKKVRRASSHHRRQATRR